MRERATRRVPTPNEPIILPGFEFFPRRDVLSAHRPLVAHINTASVVWAQWNTGTMAYVNNAMETGRIERLILPHPTQASINYLADAIGKEKEHIIDDIFRITHEANRERVKVRWHSGLTGNTIMIGDPRGPNPWAHIETIMPGVSAHDRPSFRIEKELYVELFNALLEAYENTWEASTPPDI